MLRGGGGGGVKKSLHRATFHVSGKAVFGRICFKICQEKVISSFRAYSFKHNMTYIDFNCGLALLRTLIDHNFDLSKICWNIYGGSEVLQ